MSIYRGAGGAGDAVNDSSSEATLIQQLAIEAQADADAAQASATAAAGSASTASTQATNASNSATAASTSASNASTSASTATTQATNAANSATAAQTAETNAETAETNAETAETNAETAATNAASSASAAATSATNASNSATAAAGSASTASAASAAALTALDSFDDRYLGSKSTAPTLDNDGNALAAGALYFDTVSNSMKVYTGSVWVDAYADGATFLAKASNLSDLANAATARTNLGLGTGNSPTFTALNVGAGTVSAPAITTTGDTNTGIFFPAADTIAFAEGGVESMRITSAGNVGIGTSSPATNLHINETDVSGTDFDIVRFSTASGGVINFVCSDLSSSTPTWTLQTGTSEPLAFKQGTTERMRIDSSGNLAIGTTTSGGKLTIKNPSSSGEQDIFVIQGATNTTSIAKLTFDQSVDQFKISANTTAGFLVFGTGSGGTERMRIDSSGNVGIGTSSPQSLLDVRSSTGGTLTLSTSDNIVSSGDVIGVINFQAPNEASGSQSILVGAAISAIASVSNFNSTNNNTDIVFSTNATSATPTERMRIDSSGRVLIGSTTASGSNLLQVTGDASISGLTVGKGGGAVASNTAFGVSALNSGSAGTGNAAFGTYALVSTTGANNSAFGSSALSANTSGNNNVSVGNSALGNNTTASNNTAVGYQSLYTNTTGYQNTAIGWQSAYSNTTGLITAIGSQAGYRNTTGVDNIAIGGADGSIPPALYNNTTGSYNSAVGYGALGNNTTASNNTAVGYQAGYSNTTGTELAAFGYRAAYSQTTPANSYNVAIGNYALYTNQTGTQNTVVGWNALANTTVGNNTAIGYQALTSDTSGTANTAMGVSALQSNTTASNNTAVGYQAGYSTTTGFSNVYVGNYAGGAVTTATGSVFVGTRAGQSVTTGICNTLVGGSYGAYVGGSLTTGARNTFIGTDAGGSVTTGSNNTIIGGYNGNQGGLDIRTASNYIVLSDGDGNPRIWINNTGLIFSVPTYNNTAAGSANMLIDSNGIFYRATSSLKYKTEVKDATYGLAEIMQLRPVTYKGKATTDGDKVFGGLIAEEVDAVGLNEFVVYADDGTPDALAYGNMVSLCIKAIQELNAKVEAQALEIATLKGN